MAEDTARFEKFLVKVGMRSEGQAVAILEELAARTARVRA